VAEPDAPRHALGDVLELLAERDHVLLDFDGPVCAEFGGQLSDREAAIRLHPCSARPLPLRSPARTTRSKCSAMPPCGPATAKVVEAIASAPETPGAAQTMRDLHRAGFTLTIASNSSIDALRAFLQLHDLAQYVRGISARTGPDPALLKPSPFLVEQAIRSLGTSSERCVLVGDSATEIEAAHAADTAAIAYANKPNKPNKPALFRDFGTEFIIDEIGQIQEAITSN
jgi:beta-phosphoglucomutase-like phosphatase (HAD superfamily)